MPLTKGPQLDSLVSAASSAFGQIFVCAIEVAAPAMLALMITDVAFGMVSRVVPQLNVFAVGFPVKVGVALLVVAATLPFLGGWISRSADERGRQRAARDEDRLMPSDDKTEKATPKRRQEARKKGQVAKSPDFNGAIVLIVALFDLSWSAQRWSAAGAAMRSRSARSRTPPTSRAPPG